MSPNGDSETVSNETNQESTSKPKQTVGSDMPVISHLEELRNRIIYSILAFLVALVIAFQFREFILSVALYPYPEGFNPIVLDVTERILNYLKISVVAALIIASPFIIGQLWAFISPALLPNEKKLFLPAVPIILFLFLAGAAFGYFVILRFALSFLLTFGSEEIVNQIRLNNAINFVTNVSLACGIAFQLPVVVLLLSRAGIVNDRMLRSKRKVAILVNFVLASVLIPTHDPFTMILIAAPMILLYEISIIIAKISSRRTEVENVS